MFTNKRFLKKRRKRSGVRSFLCPPPPAQDRVKLFAPPPSFKGWKRFAPLPLSMVIKTSSAHVKTLSKPIVTPILMMANTFFRSPPPPFHRGKTWLSMLTRLTEKLMSVADLSRIAATAFSQLGECSADKRNMYNYFKYKNGNHKYLISHFHQFVANQYIHSKNELLLDQQVSFIFGLLHKKIISPWYKN